MTTMQSVSKTPSLATWLAGRCKQEKLSYRTAAARTGISHGTIAAIIKGVRPSAVTIGKLAKAFGTNGQNHVAELEDELLGLCGYRSAHPVTRASGPVSILRYKLVTLNDAQLKLVESFVNYCAMPGTELKLWKDQIR